jgi:hypothetical protein
MMKKTSNTHKQTSDNAPKSAQKVALTERLAYLRAHFSQLSAWVNFTGIFILLHLATLVVIASVLLLSLQVDLTLLLAPLYVVYASYALFLGRRLWAYSRDNLPLNKQTTKTGNRIQAVIDLNSIENSINDS